VIDDYPHHGGGDRQDISTPDVELCRPTSPYIFPFRETNENKTSHYDRGADILQPNNTIPTKEAVSHVRNISSQLSNNASETGTTSSRLLSRSESWAPEIVSLILAVLSMVAMIAMLAHFNGRALPLWPSTFVTLNAVVAVLVTMTAAFVGIPLSNGLSQIKWIRVKGAAGAPLSDMDMFDNASRGAMGSFGMLVRGRGG
jgi:hypothetical protein